MVDANFYRGARFTWHQRRRHALVRRLTKGCAGKRILDYGCGYGDLSFALAKTNSVVGIDVDSDRIAFCRQQYPELEFHEFDGRTAPFPDASFDVVLSSVVLPFVDDQGAYLTDVRRVLNENGILVLVSKNVAVVTNSLRRLFGKSAYVHRLNVVPKSDIRELLHRLGFQVDVEDYFFDPPFVDWHGWKGVATGVCEQLMSVAGLSSAASYYAFRANYRR